MTQHTQEYIEKHYIHRSNWLRAAVLGANDGILSTASIAIGVASAGSDRHTIILAALAGVVAGAASMAAGEYVSVSSQCDLEEADIEREKFELETMPEYELNMLTQIYIDRGLKPDTALKVAKELTAHDALGAHIRDELGINDKSPTNALQAAIASAAAFIMGGALPLLVTIFGTMDYIVMMLYICALIFLVLLGIVAAHTGGSSVSKAVIRITLWGTIAMVLTAVVGYIFDVNVH